MKPVCVVLPFLIFYYCRLFGQDAGKIKPLMSELMRAKADTTRADVYAKLCFNYCTTNTDSAFWYGKQAMILSVKNNYEKGIADAYNNLGWAYYTISDYKQAEKYISEALTRFRKMADHNMIAVPLSNLANIYLQQSNYTLALTYFMQSLTYFEEAGNKTAASQILYNIGRIYNLQKNPTKARNYFQQSLSMSKQEGNELFAAQALSSIANTYQFEEKYDTALLYYKQVLPVFVKRHDFYRTGNTYENIASAYINKKQYAAAITNMQMAKTLYEKINSISDIAYANRGLAEAYSKSGNTAAAFIANTKALAAAKQTGDENLEQEVKRNMSECFQRSGDYKNAFLYADSANAIKDSLFSREKEDALLKLQTQFETERNEKENQLLKAQNFATVLQLQRNRWLLIIFVVCILLLSGLLYALFRNRQSKIKNIQRLKELNIKLGEQKNEISRINTILELKALRAQMNPHFIFNCMSSIQECMLTGRLDDANNYLTKLSRLLRMVLNYSDEESISLDKELQVLELYLQLEKIRLKNNLEYTIYTDSEITGEELAIPALILQPFAENAIWHGLVNKQGERKLIILAEIKNDMLHFTITDNGIGRNRAKELKPEIQRHQSKGIELIKKRLDIIKAKTKKESIGFIIHDLYDNNISAGTSVEINLPLEAI